MTDYEKQLAILAMGLGIFVAMNTCLYSCSRRVEESGGARKGAGAGVLAQDARQSPVKDAGMVESKDATESLPKKSRTKASLEREYVLRSADEIFVTENEKRLGELLSDPKRGAEALEEAKRGGREALVALRKALRCDRKNVRVQAVLVLGNLKKVGKEEVEALRDALLLDPDEDVRAYSAKAFVAIKDKGAVPALVRCLKEDPFPQARANAVWALSLIGGGQEVKEAVIKALSDEDAWVRLRAVSAIGRLKIRGAESELARLKDDPSPMVRERALQVLKELR
jgi:HEAT repeat protein